MFRRSMGDIIIKNNGWIITTIWMIGPLPFCSPARKGVHALIPEQPGSSRANFIEARFGILGRILVSSNIECSDWRPTAAPERAARRGASFHRFVGQERITSVSRAPRLRS